MWYALGITVVFSILFYFMLMMMNKKAKLENRIEVRLISNQYDVKLSKKKQKVIIKLATYYYLLLFFIGAVISFYIGNLIYVALLDLIVFMTGLYLGSKLLLKYGKGITNK